METETNTKTREPVRLAETMQPGVYRLERDGGRAYLTRDDVQAVVQQAYDLLGIVAEPDIAREAQEWAARHRAEVRRAHQVVSP